MSEANDYYSPDQDHRVRRRTDNIRTHYLSFLSQCCQQLVLCIGQLCFCTPQCVEVPGDKMKTQKCQVLGVYRPLRPKSVIPHPITIQNMIFEQKKKNW